MTNRYTIARICELYMGYNIPLADIARMVGVGANTVSRTIDKVLKFRSITDRNTHLIVGMFKMEEV